MGAAVFAGLVIIATVITATVVGYLMYGMVLGIASLANHIKRVIGHFAAANEEIAAMEAGVRRQIRAAGDSHDVWPPARCWEYKECPSGVRESCAAYRRRDVPCWLACMQASGDQTMLKPGCLACRLFNLTTLMAQP